MSAASEQWNWNEDMLSTGIDLIDIKRVRKLLDENRDHFLKRICTPQEIENLKNQKRQDQKVAALFSLKEAFSKALGTGFSEKFSFHDAEVSYTPLGQPLVHYVGRQFRGAGEWKITCSVSHEGDMLVSIVIIQGDLT